MKVFLIIIAAYILSSCSLKTQKDECSKIVDDFMGKRLIGYQNSTPVFGQTYNAFSSSNKNTLSKLKNGKFVEYRHLDQSSFPLYINDKFSYFFKIDSKQLIVCENKNLNCKSKDVNVDMIWALAANSVGDSVIFSSDKAGVSYYNYENNEITYNIQAEINVGLVQWSDGFYVSIYNNIPDQYTGTWANLYAFDPFGNHKLIAQDIHGEFWHVAKNTNFLIVQGYGSNSKVKVINKKNYSKLLVEKIKYYESFVYCNDIVIIPIKGAPIYLNMEEL